MWNAMACAVMVLMALMIWPDSARSGRLTGVSSDVAGEGGAAVSLPLLIGLLSVSLRSGMSVTRSLEGVGEAVGGALGGGLCAVADALHRGSSWKDAWNAADFGDYAETSAILRGVLGPSWTRGVSPIGPLTTASEQWTEGERTAINYPVSPNVKKNMIMGGLIGAVLAVGVFTLLFLLDDTIKSEEDVRRYLQLNTLASIIDQ